MPPKDTGKFHRHFWLSQVGLEVRTISKLPTREQSSPLQSQMNVLAATSHAWTELRYGLPRLGKREKNFEEKCGRT